MPTPIPLVGPSTSVRSWTLSSARCINLYPELLEGPKGKSISALYGTPGLRLFCTLPEAGGCRGLYTTQASPRVFAVAGGSLYELDAGGTFTVRGALLTYSGPVSLADNGTQLVLVDGRYGYTLTLGSNAFAVIDDPDFYPSDRVAFLDGYFIFGRKGTAQFFISGLYDGRAYLGTDFASAEGSPDPLVSLIVDHRELWVFGSSTTEVFYNSGNPDFPFDRFQGAFIEQGIVGPWALAHLDNSVLWVGADANGQAMVWRAVGYQPQRISTHAVEHSLGQVPDLSSLTTWTYQQEGHTFFVLNLPTTTWVYDTATLLWHERGYLQDTGALTRHRAQWHTMGWGQHLVGDYQFGHLYTLDLDTYTDNGAEILRERTFPSVTGEGKRIRHHHLELDMEVGVGLDGAIVTLGTAGPASSLPGFRSPLPLLGLGTVASVLVTTPVLGTDPQVMLQWSDDDAKTWSNEHWASMGRIGAYRTRVRWTRLGQAWDRVYRIRVTDPIKVAIVGAFLEPS